MSVLVQADTHVQVHTQSDPALLCQNINIWGFDLINIILFISQCDAGKATNIMYEMLYSEPTKHMILGPACSIESEVTAQASADWNITHVSIILG